MKKQVLRFLQWLVSDRTLFLKLKDTVFTNPSEHLYRTVAYVRQHHKKQEGFAIVDIGAADGGTADFFSKEFPESTIYGFEPIHLMYETACRLNSGNPNVFIKNVALSDKSGQQELNVTANYLSSSLHDLDNKELDSQPAQHRDKFNILEKQVVETSTLDQESKGWKEILLIKIDTQGSELTILQNGIETLKRTRLVLIEMNNHHLYKNGCQYYDVDAFLRQQHFKLADVIVTYRAHGQMEEYDALYENMELD